MSILGTAPIEIASNKPFVHVRINGSKPQRFMLDTGSNATLIDPSLAAALKFHSASESKGYFGVGNARQSIVRLEPAARLELAGATADGIRLLGFDLSQVSSVEGLQVRGTVGGQFLQHFVVRIDYAAGRVTVFDPSFEYQGTGIVLPVTIDRQIFTMVRIHKSSGEVVEGKFYLDTGTRTAISLNSPFVREHQMVEGERAIPVATIGVGMGGESLASVYRIPEIELGSLHVRDVVATASLDEKGVFADPKVAGIIGGELLRKFTVILDYPHQRVILETSPARDTPFQYDASGLFLLAGGPALDAIRIFRVIEGSPAEDAGLQKNDVIETIDGKRARNLDHVRDLFRQPGQTYELRILRDGKRIDVVMRTEDLLARSRTTKGM